ncbi:MAG: hypothetical protein E7645_03865 [Ruminococcaceae bacterium]|nr:hypothetical protein [Oscillospiraceae bacterium]
MNKMKEFFSRYSYDSVKMLVDQLVLSIFGFGLAMASVHAQNDTLLMITGVGSVIFYLTMLYSVAWKMGSSDRPTIETGNRKFNPLTGALVSLVANIPGLLMATIFMINSFLGNGGGFAGIIGRFINGMYLGLMTLIEFNGDHLHAYWWMYFLLIIPSVLVCTVGYVMGVKSKLLAKLMTPQLPASDRPTRKELKERREEKKK